MNNMKIINGQVITGGGVIRGAIIKGGIIKGAAIIIDGSKIQSVGKRAKARRSGVIDAKGYFVSPGFIDSHIHGDPAKVLAHEIRYGTTAIVPAISCSSSASLAKSINSIKRFKDNEALGESVVGLRLEGPYISRERAGAQDKRFIKEASTAGLYKIVKRCGKLLKIMTIAPELDGSRKLIRILGKKKIVASMGHTSADYEGGAKGIDAGITHATHLFNGMRRMAANGSSAAFACLSDDRVVVEIIFDLIHVQPELLYLALAMKKKESIVLITDSVKAEAGGSKFGGGVYRIRDGTIAGSSLTMIGAVKNAVRACGVALTDAVAFATINPAKLLGVDARKGSITKGKDADIVIFDKDFDVKMTIVRGKIAYRKRGF